MNLYTFLSWFYDLADVIWFSEKGKNPRNVINNIIPDENCRVLDLCCGTLTNGLCIAESKKNSRIYGIDRSKEMLREAKKKCKKKNINNIKIKCADATDTKIKSGSFDYIILGLVLHECTPNLAADILKEARRLLKDDGKLIVLEWDEETTLIRRLKFAPLYLFEILDSKYFIDFFKCDKKKYFKKNGFTLTNYEHCNYTSVMTLTKNNS